MSQDTDQLEGAAAALSVRTRLHGDAARLAVRVRPLIKPPRTVILLGGVGMRHGAPEIAARLAMSLVTMELEGRVLLLDANIRDPFIAGHFGLKGSKGLAYALNDKHSAKDAVDTESVPNLAILPAFKEDAEHTRAILSSVGTPLLAKLSEQYEVIVISGPGNADTFEFAVWASHANHVVLAAGEGAHRSEIVEAKKTIEEAGASLAGLVLTYHD